MGFQYRHLARAMGTVGVFRWSFGTDCAALRPASGASPGVVPGEVPGRGTDALPELAAGLRAARLGEKLAARWAELDRRLSNFRADSDMSLGVDSADARAVRVAARRLGRLSEGLFCAERGGFLDTGGIAKGYAADQIRDSAVRAGATDVLVSLGTSSIARAGRGVWVGLESPWAGLDGIGRLFLDVPALSVSADPGRPPGPPGSRARSRHAIDPRTGRAALTDLAGVLVCGADGMVCEALSTAYLVAGRSEAMRMDREIPEVRSIFFGVDGRMHADPRLVLQARPGLNAFLRSAAEAGS